MAMAQCSGPISPENLPGPSGLNQVEQEKEKSPQQPRPGLFENGNGEFIDNSENFMEAEGDFAASVAAVYDDSDSDDGLDVVYGPNPPAPSRMIQRPLYNQECPSNNTSSICTRQQSSSRSWNHEGEHYSYSYSYPRVSRVHPQGFYHDYDPPPPPPPSFRQSRYISVRDWAEPSRDIPPQRDMPASRPPYRHSDPHDPYDMGYPPVLRHPNRHRHRRQHMEPVAPRIPYHTRTPVEIDMDYLDYDQGPPPPTSMAEGIRRPGPEAEMDIAGIRNIRQEQQRQVIMRNASTSTPPIPSLRQHASTSTQPPVEANSRKRTTENKPESEIAVPPKKSKRAVNPLQTATEDAELVNGTPERNVAEPEQQTNSPPATTDTELSEDNPNFLLCNENLPDEDAESGTFSVPLPTGTEASNVSVVTNEINTSESVPASRNHVSVLTATGSQSESASVATISTVTSVVSTGSGTKAATSKTETRAVPASEIEFVTSTLKPRSKPSSKQTSRKTSPNTSRASPVHVAAYSQEALRDLVCATLAPAAAANLIKSEKREKKERESSRSSPDPIDDPQPGPSGLQRIQPTQDEPGPSGLQQQTSTSSSNDLQADDLQLDCLSSDTEGSSSEDVQVVKISRRKKSHKKPVEVDLTQEMTSDDDGDIVIEEVRSRPVSVPSTAAAPVDSENKPEINVKTFASVPDNVTNIQSSSRGSTPAASNTDHHYANNPYMPPLASSLTVDPAWSGSGPPSYQHRDHGYVRHARVNPDVQIRSEFRPVEEPRPDNTATEEHSSINPEDRNETLNEAAMNDIHFRPRRLRHPWHHEDSRRCEYRHSSSMSCPAACPCVNRHRSQTSHSGGEYPSSGHGQHQHQHHPHQQHYTNPPPAHRSSMYPNTPSQHPSSIPINSYNRVGGTRPGSLLRAVQRMNPRHQRLYQLQQQTTEQLRRWSVRAPPPPYPTTAAANAASTAENSSAEQPAAPASACAENANSATQQQPQANATAADAQQPSASGASSHQERAPPQPEPAGGAPGVAPHRPMLSVPRVIMSSRPTLHIPQSGASLLLPRTYENARGSHSHTSSNHQFTAPNQSVPPPLASRVPQMDPPPAHQPAPLRFPEEVQLPDSRRARRCPRWHIPVMGDPHPPYPHPEVEPVPLDMHTNPIYHPPPYHPNMIPPNAHHGSMAPVMVDPRDPLMDPAGVPLGRENLAYGGMFNILFQPHRMGGLEVCILHILEALLLNCKCLLFPGIHEVNGSKKSWGKHEQGSQ